MYDGWVTDGWAGADAWVMEFRRGLVLVWVRG
jgi:hypothetical protein